MFILSQILVIFFSIFYFICIDSYNIKKFKISAIFLSFLVFFISILSLIFNTFNGLYKTPIIFKVFSLINFEFLIASDGMSTSLTILTTFLIFICCIISYKTINIKVKEYYICFFLLELFLILTFNLLNLIFFYIFFESTLIPMYFIIGIWGSKNKKTRAAFLFFIYTLIGSLFMLYAIIHIYVETGTLNYFYLINYPFIAKFQILYWLAFFLSFAVKVPIVPFHIWLPEAHVEAPTTGSMILAGVLLKLGAYGFLRFSLGLFPFASFFFRHFIYSLCVFSVIYSSIIAFRQNDLKKLIAYASIAHMNLIILGIFSFNKLGIDGALLQIIGHCFTSSGLFLIIGNLYERYHTRIIKYYGGLSEVMPKFSSILFIYILANMSFPGTLNFVGEFLILKGIFSSTKIISILSSSSLFLSCIYSLTFYNKLCKGTIGIFTNKFEDLDKLEIVVHIILLSLIVIFGFFPNIILDCLKVQFYIF